jgi:glycerate-2-kinase
MQRRELLEEFFQAGVRAADPRQATARAVAALDLQGTVSLVALGKGAVAMAAGAATALADRDITPAAGLVVSHDGGGDPPAGMAHVIGDHPVPGEGSIRAARAIGDFCSSARASSHVLVLLSGGATSLCAAPVDGVSEAAMRETFTTLLRSGAPITAMNAIRRRILRWAGGRLAVALQPARIHCLIVSDVMSNNLAAIASGPCMPDPLTADDLLAMRQQPGPGDLPDEVVSLLRRVSEGAEPETPKPGNPAFRNVHAEVVLDNAVAVEAVCAAARQRGLEIDRGPQPLDGEAADQGRAIARGLMARAAAHESLGGDAPRLWVWGGETTVTMAGPPAGSGGRCQELALAFAAAVHTAAHTGPPITLLAAGTDGRDGPTDAAGAVVDHDTWRRVARAGRDPSRDLATHDAYAALAAADALLVTGATGTNVNDLVIAAIG